MVNLGKVVVIDLELTCWEGPPPSLEHPKIIEVGIVVLTTTSLEISKPRRLFIKPGSSSISAYCTSLTGITPELLEEKGKTVDEVRSILLDEFKMNERAWGAWGNDGLCLTDCFGDVFSSNYLNIASLFTLAADRGKRIGLQDSLRMLGLDPVGKAHNGGDDALNAARVLKQVFAMLRLGIGDKAEGKLSLDV